MEKIFIEKKSGVDIESRELLEEFRSYLGIRDLKNVRLIDRYDLKGAKGEEKKLIVENVFLEPLTDIYSESLELKPEDFAFRVEDLKGQFNKREHFTNKLIKLMFPEKDIEVAHSKIIVLEAIDREEFETIKDFYINPVELKEVPMDGSSFKEMEENKEGIVFVDGFIDFKEEELESFKDENGIGMDMEDLIFIKDYFKREDRDPSLTEIKLIDTYWSDHCRHTTFTTRINDIQIEEGRYRDLFEREIKNYMASRDYTYGDRDKRVSLMDLATINMKELKKKGLLEDKEETDEINAASIEIDVDRDGKNEKWLLMFKNETHNHPTEMEAFGGASTCLGGAIRDPLSGRAYVYQAMRITGAKDPREKFQDTLKGKLPQRKITRTAMKGYSSYGNEIGASTGFVREIYDDGFVAKRLECGALVAAAPKENVYRGQAKPGDIIVLVGGRTGRDGLGGAVGSSKEHSQDSLDSGAAEVQKGNPSLERKIMRMFRKPEVSKMIKVCNDFGAGGVGVAIGELADGILVELDKVPLKYPGLSPSEITLSESQERMACLIEKDHREKFLAEAKKEDLEATVVAYVVEEKTLTFTYKGEKVVDIKREFLDTNGVEKNTDIKLVNPQGANPLNKEKEMTYLEKDILDMLRDINISSQKGLVENFDNSVSGETVLMPYGGKYMLSPSEGMVSKIPLLQGETETTSIMTFGYDPNISKWSPFHGGYYAVIESLARLAALGGSYRGVRFTFQEYFERLGEDRAKWGKPFLSLLGAFSVQKDLDLASIGGKDSMSGSFEDIDVPPTLISFAVQTEKIGNILTSEFKKPNSKVVLIDIKRDENSLLDLEDLKDKYDRIYRLNKKGMILSALSVKNGGTIRSILEMSFGNKIGFKCSDLDLQELFKPKYGSIVLELDDRVSLSELGEFTLLGSTIEEEKIIIDHIRLDLDSLIDTNTRALKEVFPAIKGEMQEEKEYEKNKEIKIVKAGRIAKPKIVIPIFTGSHGEYTLKNSFERFGGQVDSLVFNFSNKREFQASILELKEKISKSQILALPHGLVFGGEPNGGGKLGKYILEREEIKEELDNFLENTDGLILGIGDGFQTLLKAGLMGDGLGVLSANLEGGFVSTFADLEVKNSSSPWFNMMEEGDVYSAPLGSYEGRLVLNKDVELDGSQIASKFIGTNPTGSQDNIESLTSYNGRILGTITSIDRMKDGLYKNIDIKSKAKIFQSAIKYFN